MEYRKLGRSNIIVSVLGLGALEIGRNWPYWRKERPDFNRPSEAEAHRVVHEALDHGINIIDTAPAYFKSEEILGRALRGKRNNVILATKCGEWFDGEHSVYNYSYDETLVFIEKSLANLRTDYIDVLQIHSANADVLRRGETLAAMKEAQKKGMIRFIGLSTEYEDAACLAIDSGEFDAIQISYNMLNQTMMKTVIPAAHAKNVGIIIKDGMATGRLSYKSEDISSAEEKAVIDRLREVAAKNSLSIDECAVRFVISSEKISTVIVGTRNVDHLDQNAEAVASGALRTGILDSIREGST